MVTLLDSALIHTEKKFDGTHTRKVQAVLG
jgi:hypothetical protein